MPPNEAVLILDGVRHTYGATGQANFVVALESIDIRVERGEFVAICGPSGCGKTTLLELLSGLRMPTEGRILLNDEELSRPRREIGVVFQEESTFPWRTVIENVEFGLQMQKTPKRERRKRATAMVDLVGLRGFENHYPHQLSGGMRQRVAIARTLVTNPALVVMDEPFGALDEQTRLMLGSELLRIVGEIGATVVFVTHSLQEAALLSDRIVMMTARPGRIKTDVKNSLPKPRDASVLATNAFAEITQKLWANLEQILDPDRRAQAKSDEASGRKQESVSRVEAVCE